MKKLQKCRNIAAVNEWCVGGSGGGLFPRYSVGLWVGFMSLGVALSLAGWLGALAALDSDRGRVVVAWAPTTYSARCL